MNALNFYFLKGKTVPFYILMPLVMLAGVSLIFLPFGLNQVGIIEDWGIFALLDQHGPTYFITKNSPMAGFILRPLMVLPQSIAHFLDKNSFFYWNFQQFVFIWLKGISVGYIIWWLYPGRWVAIFGGLLLMLYPADTQQTAIRILSINGSVALTLSAIASLLWATRLNTLWARTMAAIWASTLFLCGCFMYEGAFLLSPTPLLLWWAKFGWKDGWLTLKTQKVVTVLWLTAMITELSYVFWYIKTGGLYQSAVTSDLISTLKTMWLHSPLLVKYVWGRIFVHGWYDAGGTLLAGGKTGITFWLVAALSTLLIIIGLNTKPTHKPGSTIPQLNSGFLTRWLVVSVLITVLGHLSYFALPGYLHTTQRTYLFSGVGGALFFTGFILIIQKRFRLVGAGLAGCLLLCGIAAQWTQLSFYSTVSNKERAILSGILEAAACQDQKKTLFIIDRTGSLNATMLLRSSLLNCALAALDIPRETIVCLEPGLLWNGFPTDALGRMGKCVEHTDTWQIGQGLSCSFSVQKKQLVTLIIEQDGRVHSTETTSIPLPTPNQQPRWAKILGCWPAKACLAQSHQNPLPDHFTFNFGKCWDLEELVPGAGWQHPQWTAHGAIAWMNQPQSSLLFHLSPQPTPYLLQLNLVNSISEPARMSLKIVLNGHTLPYHWQDTLHALAKIDPSWLKGGVNELLFLTDIDPIYGISVGVRSVKVMPQ